MAKRAVDDEWRQALKRSHVERERTLLIKQVAGDIPATVVMIDNPLARFPGDKAPAVRSLRDDPLAAMRAAGQIDEAKYHAGRHWQAAYELAEIGGARAIDTTKEAVDGGRGFPDLINDKRGDAIADLTAACRALGQEGEAIVRDILGRGMTIALAAGKRGMVSESDRKYIGRRFREGLETLAVVFGYATKG